MKLTEDVKKKIDQMSFETMLSMWRFAPAGNPLFEGESGEYYKNQMKIKKERHPNPSYVSKQLGWE